MKSTPSAPTALTLFDASQFEFETDPDAKSPTHSLPTHSLPTLAIAPTPRTDRFGGSGLARGDPSQRDAARARRQRARARVAKRRYLADSEGFERLLQTRRALHLVGD